MKVSNLDVFERGDVMFLSFSCSGDKGEDAGRQLFDALSSKAIKRERDGWCDINQKFDVRFDERSNKIEVREKNNPPGPYGHAAVLKMVPAELLRQGFIDVEQMTEMDQIIDQSTPVLKRADDRTEPDYMRMRE